MMCHSTLPGIMKTSTRLSATCVVCYSTGVHHNGTLMVLLLRNTVMNVRELIHLFSV